MRPLALISILLSFFGVALSQSTNVSTFLYSNVKKADHFYDHFAYRNALEIYLHVNEKDKENIYVREKIADCYFRLHDPISSEIWFDELVRDESLGPELKLEYARVLSMNGRYDLSQHWLKLYLQDNPKDSMAVEKLNFLENLKLFSRKDDRFIISGINNINTSHSEYGAHYFHDGIVFASSRDADRLIKHKPADGVHPDESLLNLFYAVPEMEGNGKEPQHFHEDHLKTAFHEGPMAFYNNYKRGAFTQSNINNAKGVRDITGMVNLQIFFADVAHLGYLQNITPFEHNYPEFSNAHPTFSRDGKQMYFSSTRNSGFGESDIYYCEWLDGHWTYPVNVGPQVNTRGDESFPFLANDTTLFFSSNGHGSLGGLDIYVSYSHKGKFSRPVNIGPPANTRFDDFSFCADSTGRIGFLASNRPGGEGLDDIYYFVAKYYALVGTVRQLSTDQPILPNTLITVKNGNGDVIDTVTSNENGMFRLDLPYDQDFIITGIKEGYETLEGLKFSTKGKPFGIDSIMLPLWKYNLYAKGKIYNNETEEPLEGATVILKNITENSVDSVIIGKDGAYSFLALPNKKYEFSVRKNRFIPVSLEVSTKDMMEGELLNDFVLEGIYVMKEVLLYEYNGDNLTNESSAQLEHIYRTLRNNKTSYVFIGAHADSRGSSGYNLGLSKRRAASVVDYLIKRGISKNRMDAIGFGEQLIINRCIDGISCTNEEHGTNRRAEVKIVMKN